MGEPICRQRLSVADARLAPPEGLLCTWSASVDVDASRCSATHRRIEIILQREKENAPDLELIERFDWRTGTQRAARIDVSVDFWIDEAVQPYMIGAVEPCACRS